LPAIDTQTGFTRILRPKPHHVTKREQPNESFEVPNGAFTGDDLLLLPINLIINFNRRAMRSNGKYNQFISVEGEFSPILQGMHGLNGRCPNQVSGSNPNSRNVKFSPSSFPIKAALTPGGLFIFKLRFTYIESISGGSEVLHFLMVQSCCVFGWLLRIWFLGHIKSSRFWLAAVYPPTFNLMEKF
jgi:hypothetical protein